MPGITDALNSSANHLRSLETALAVIQSNVGNTSTPGYARQDLVGGQGAAAGGVLEQVSSRNDFAEQAVHQQNSLLGQYDQLASVLNVVEPGFGPSADAEIPKAIGNLFASFSALTASPNDVLSRQTVLNQATQLGQTFNNFARSLQSNLAEARHQVTASVDSINRLAGQVRDFNVTQANNASVGSNASVDAKLFETLENVSEFADIQTLRQNDGTLTLLLGGQTALVVGKNLYPIQADATSSTTTRILNSNGSDITPQVTSGRLNGALEVVNKLLPSYQTGLDQLAQGIADSVNTALGAGVDSNGTPGAPLFTYDPANVAASLATTGIGTGDLAAASAAAPGGNGNALALAGLETSPTINGFTYSGFYGNLAAGVGRDTANAVDKQGVQRQLLAQARAQRNDTSGVSLDEEAVRLVEYQRAYQATAQLVVVLDQLSQVTLNMIH